jgi:hypothetical protein
MLQQQHHQQHRHLPLLLQPQALLMSCFWKPCHPLLPARLQDQPRLLLVCPRGLYLLLLHGCQCCASF